MNRPHMRVVPTTNATTRHNDTSGTTPVFGLGEWIAEEREALSQEFYETHLRGSLSDTKTLLDLYYLRGQQVMLERIAEQHDEGAVHE